METKFTKGPWEVDAMGNIWLRGETKVVDFSHPPIVSSLYRRVSDEEHAANRNLIAAAPALYEALEALVGEPHSPDSYDKAIAAARAALAKARGEAK